MKEELISIIIPIYNVEQFCEESIKSVMTQNYNNLEIILINDGSTDKSLEICEKLKAEDNRIILISQKNGGLSKARNTGIEKSKGKYITFIDSDDIISKNYINDLYKGIKKYNNDIAVCGYIRFLNRIPKEERNNKINNMKSNDFLEKLLYQEKQELYSVSACNKMYKRNVFDEIKFPEDKIYEDVAIITDIIDATESISVIDNYNYFYRINPKSITNKEISTKNMEIINFIEKIIKKYDNQETLKKGAINLLFRRTIELLSKYDKSKNKNKEMKKKLYINIKKYRKIIILDKKAKCSTKISAILAYFNMLFLIIKVRNIWKGLKEKVLI